MKKLLMALLCICAVFTKAQAIEIGEAVIVDGIPALVIYVDDSGEHGLYMTGTALSEEQFTDIMEESNKSIAETLKKQGLEVPAQMPTKKYPMPYIKYEEKIKASKQDVKLIESNLLPQLGGKGDENQAAIKQFCADNNLDFATLFPLEYWAAQIGEGWFIPGAEEIFYFRKIITGNGPSKSDMTMDASKKPAIQKITDLYQKFAAKATEVQMYAQLPAIYEKTYTSSFDKTPWSSAKENKKFIGQEDHFTNAIINASFAAANAKKYGASDDQASAVARISYRASYITNAWWAQVVAVKRF